jgi:hypothetical protein|tara:strand:- start:6390 stop:6557 length:168 start_codon:yes stop_codon:yes gene_type:complete
MPGGGGGESNSHIEQVSVDPRQLSESSEMNLGTDIFIILAVCIVVVCVYYFKKRR